jgi:hypothetical protein
MPDNRMDWWNDPAMLEEISRRPPQQLVPNPLGLPPLPGFQNPGAGLLPDFAPIGQQRAPGYSDMPAAALNALRTEVTNRPNLNIDLQPTNGPRLPQIFNGGVQAAPDIAIPAAPGAAPSPGYRRTISADGGPTYFQQVRPEERGLNGQDLLRQGTSVAEIQAAHPGWSASQQLDLYRQLQQDAASAARQNFAIGNQTANQNAGIMSNADRVAFENARAHTTTAGAAQTQALTDAAKLEAALSTAQQRHRFIENVMRSNPHLTPAQINELVAQEEARGGFAASTLPFVPGRPGQGSGGSSGTGGNANQDSSLLRRTGEAAPTTPTNPPLWEALSREIEAIPTLRRPGAPTTGPAAGVVPLDRSDAGEFLSRLNTQRPGLFDTSTPQGRQSLDALRAYLEQRFGPEQIADLATGVRATPFGYLTPTTSGSWLTNLGRTLENVASPITGPLGLRRGTMDESQLGRAMYRTSGAHNRRPSAR